MFSCIGSASNFPPSLQTTNKKLFSLLTTFLHNYVPCILIEFHCYKVKKKLSMKSPLASRISSPLVHNLLQMVLWSPYRYIPLLFTFVWSTCSILWCYLWVQSWLFPFPSHRLHIINHHPLQPPVSSLKTPLFFLLSCF